MNKRSQKAHEKEELKFTKNLLAANIQPQYLLGSAFIKREEAQNTPPNSIQRYFSFIITEQTCIYRVRAQQQIKFSAMSSEQQRDLMTEESSANQFKGQSSFSPSNSSGTSGTVLLNSDQQLNLTQFFSKESLREIQKCMKNSPQNQGQRKKQSENARKLAKLEERLEYQFSEGYQEELQRIRRQCREIKSLLKAGFIEVDQGASICIHSLLALIAKDSSLVRVLTFTIMIQLDDDDSLHEALAHSSKDVAKQRPTMNLICEKHVQHSK